MPNLYESEQWEDVTKSSNITGIGVKDDYLIVRFKGGASYRYPDAKKWYLILKNSQSMGSTFAKCIKRLQFEKLCSKGCWEKVVTIEAGMCEKCTEEEYKSRAF